MIPWPEQHWSEDGKVHIYPVVDFYPHRLHAKKCWCKPVKDEDRFDVFIHNPIMDGAQPTWQ